MNITGGTNLTGVNIIDSLRVPGTPTIGSITSDYLGLTTPFTAPAFNGYTPITSYTAVLSPGSFTQTLNQSTSGTFTITGLSPQTTYSIDVYATNIIGNSSNASSSATTLTLPSSQIEYTTAGTYTWTVPGGVYSISVVTVSGGQSGENGNDGAFHGGRGGQGGSLAYINNISVTPGWSVGITVGAGGSGNLVNGGNSSITVNGSSHGCTGGSNTRGQAIGTVTALGQGGDYGLGYTGSNNTAPGGGGGGAGGYGGTGGAGGVALTGGAASGGTGANGAGGGGNGGYVNYKPGMGGGGVGIYGRGTNGSSGGGGGSSGTNGGAPGTLSPGGAGGTYGGGGGGGAAWNSQSSGHGGGGAIRIIWPGNLRYFPTTRTANE